MKNKSIDINCDLGEGIGNESVLMPLISSCNIACGGHAGDVETTKKVIELAKIHDVKIGAHPSFPDRENFGRKIMEMTNLELEDTLVNQIFGTRLLVESCGLQLHHIKPHGALYNLAAIDERTATIIVKVIKNFNIDLKLYAPYNSVISKIAKQKGLKVIFEGFADRNYNEDLTLVSRLKSNAMIHDSAKIFDHVLNMISNGKVTTTNGVEVALKVDTICVHGDEKSVVENLTFLRQKLLENNIEIL